MKQSVILCIFGILGFFPSSAQFKIGITGGADYAKMNIHRQYQDDFNFRGIPAFHVGLATECRVNENMSITTDLLLAKKGVSRSNYELNYPMMDSTADYHVSLYYIEIPVLAEFKARYEKMNVIFGIGPYVAYGFGGTVDLDVYSAAGTLHYSEDVRWSKYNPHSYNQGEGIVYKSGFSQLKRLDYGPAIRFGVEFNSVVLSAEYKYGLANLMWEYGADERMNNQTIGISMKYLFTLKKQASNN